MNSESEILPLMGSKKELCTFDGTLMKVMLYLFLILAIQPIVLLQSYWGQRQFFMI